MKKLNEDLHVVEFDQQVFYYCDNSSADTKLYFKSNRTLDKVSLTCLTNGSFTLPHENHTCIEGKPDPLRPFFKSQHNSAKVTKVKELYRIF